jgi:sortase A
VPVFEGTSDEVLATGFGHFAGSAGAGKVGNYALAAHRITHGEPLRAMPDLQVGDAVVVQTRTETYTYRLTTAGAALVVPFTAGWVTDPLPHNPSPGGVEPAQNEGQRLITLTTCSELFHTDNRMVAFGVLAKEVPAS